MAPQAEAGGDFPGRTRPSTTCKKIAGTPPSSQSLPNGLAGPVGSINNAGMDTPLSRDLEAHLLARCRAVGRGADTAATDAREANVFRVAAGVLRAHWPAAAERLRGRSEDYFREHPADRCSTEQVVAAGWVISLPRLRDLLSRQLADASHV